MTSGLLIGAYERDNFGDLLFLLETRRYLKGVSTEATSFIAGDMSELLGEHIAAYPDALVGSDVPFLWVVGGQTGGTSVSAARRMSGVDGDASARAAATVPEYASPYLPRPSRYASTRNALYVVNSVGVSGIRRLTGRHRVETLAALREATFLSVRERDSSAALTRSGIAHRVAPDLVHTLSRNMPLAQSRDGERALVQAKVRIINEVGVKEFAKILANSKQLASYRVRLFSAGEAPGHDSVSLLHDVAAEMARLGAGERVEVSSARTPTEKALEIATSGLWIGTSLHGYIISTAYAVPRVGLALYKLKRYSDSWEIPYPADCNLRLLDSGIEAALAAQKTSSPERKADELARLADENVKAAGAHLVEGARAGLADVRRQNDVGVQRQLAGVTKWSESRERSIQRLEHVFKQSVARIGRGTRKLAPGDQ